MSPIRNPVADGTVVAHTERIPIRIRNPDDTGNAFFNVTGLTDWDAGFWEFVNDVDGKVFGVVQVPSNITASPSAKIILSIGANATAGVTRLNVGTKDVADGESMNPAALVDETAQNVTVPGTARLRKDVTFTLTNPPAADDILIVEIFHDGDDVADTLAVNTELYDAYLEVQIT